ncbi:MAG: ribosomal protein L32 [Phycisphaerales bacterium]|nr:MAG: ribosomal protein L32 [Phycisphaerales bacterium]
MPNHEDENPFAMSPEPLDESGESGPEEQEMPAPSEPDMPETGEETDDEEVIPLEEPEEEPGPEPVKGGAVPEPVAAGGDIPVGVPVEERKEPPRRSVKDLDVCPNCGEPMRGSSTLVCMRCGFDMKTMTVVKTELGEIDEEELAVEKPPLCTAGRGDLWLPGAAAVISVLVLLIAYLIGYDALFAPSDQAAGAATAAAEIESGAESAPKAAADGIAFPLRMRSLARFVAITIFWTACGLASLLALSKLTERPFGDVKLALVRTAAVMTTMALVGLIGFGDDYYNLELATEVILRAALAFSVAMLLFSLNPRETATAGGVTLILAVLLYWGAVLITL